MSEPTAQDPQNSHSPSPAGWLSIALCLAIAAGTRSSAFSPIRRTSTRGAPSAITSCIAPEYSRANALLVQVQDPWSTITIPCTTCWRGGCCFRWCGIMVICRRADPGHAACRLCARAVARRVADLFSTSPLAPTILATLLFATLPWFFVSSGWLGYFDSWYVLGLVAAAFVPSRWVLGAVAVLTPWVDERFLLALPVILLIREASLQRMEDRDGRAALLMRARCRRAIPYRRPARFSGFTGMPIRKPIFMLTHRLCLTSCRRVPGRVMVGISGRLAADRRGFVGLDASCRLEVGRGPARQWSRPPLADCSSRPTCRARS